MRFVFGRLCLCKMGASVCTRAKNRTNNIPLEKQNYSYRINVHGLKNIILLYAA